MKILFINNIHSWYQESFFFFFLFHLKKKCENESFSFVTYRLSLTKSDPHATVIFWGHFMRSCNISDIFFIIRDNVCLNVSPETQVSLTRRFSWKQRSFYSKRNKTGPMEGYCIRNIKWSQVRIARTGRLDSSAGRKHSVCYSP